MLVELSVVEQRYHAVTEVVCGGLSLVEAAERYGLSRKAVHVWLGRYRHEGLPGLTDWSHLPHHHPRQLAAQVGARVCELRRTHLRWGPTGWFMSCAGGESIHCRRARRCIGCWFAIIWSARSRVSVAGRSTAGGKTPGRCSCGNSRALGSVLIKDLSAAGGVVEAKLISGIDDQLRSTPVMASVRPVSGGGGRPDRLSTRSGTVHTHLSSLGHVVEIMKNPELLREPSVNDS